MLSNIKKTINWKLITDNKRKQIGPDNTCENTGRIPHPYNVGDRVLCLKCGGVMRKYSKHKSEPYRITQVHTNGTVTIAQGAKRQQMSIRNIEPYNSNEKIVVTPITHVAT